MPLEINEVAIRMAVGGAGGTSGAGDGCGQEAATAETSGPGGIDPALLEELVRRCTERVLAALRADRER